MLLSFAAVAAYGQRADERYVGIYNLIQQADALRDGERPADAKAAYEEARRKLMSFQTTFPRWNEKIVKFRLEYIDSRLATLAPSIPVDVPESAPESPPVSALVPTNQLAELQQEIRQLRGENSRLQAKLREALTSQPVTTDPRELQKARQAALQLEKERDLLLVTLEQAQAAIPRVDPEVVAREQQILAEVRGQLAEQLQVTARLRQENEGLKKQLAEGKSDQSLAVELQLANAILASLRSTNIALRTERLLLEDQLAQARQGASPTGGAGEGEVAELKSRLSLLRARVEIYEAKEVPYTPEELALFKQAPLQATLTTETPAPEKRPYEIPPGAGPLMSKARQSILAGRFEEAEGIYRQILRQDPKNVFVLGNLASVQIDMGQYREAEQTLRSVLEIDPRDASSLFGIGMLSFEQGKYDEALDALSLSAQIAPDDARTHYYLGKTLVEKGSRGPAETALRRAVQLNPGMSPAHHLLAVVYATQDPPFTELAQWHYQKARQGNYPADPALEKMLAAQRAAN